MKIEVRNKWQIRAATLSIFVLGVLAGAFALNAYYLWFGGPRPLTREQRFQKIVTELKLDETQKGEVQQIMNDAREDMQAVRKEGEPKMKALREQTDEKLQKILGAEQWQKFVQIREQKKAEEKQREAAR